MHSIRVNLLAALIFYWQIRSTNGRGGKGGGGGGSTTSSGGGSTTNHSSTPHNFNLDDLQFTSFIASVIFAILFAIQALQLLRHLRYRPHIGVFIAAFSLMSGYTLLAVFLSQFRSRRINLSVLNPLWGGLHFGLFFGLPCLVGSILFMLKSPGWKRGLDAFFVGVWMILVVALAGLKGSLNNFVSRQVLHGIFAFQVLGAITLCASAVYSRRRDRETGNGSDPYNRTILFFIAPSLLILSITLLVLDGAFTLNFTTLPLHPAFVITNGTCLFFCIYSLLRVANNALKAKKAKEVAGGSDSDVSRV